MEPLFLPKRFDLPDCKAATHANAHGWPSNFAFVHVPDAPHKPPQERRPLLLPGRFHEIAAFSSLSRFSLVIRFGGWSEGLAHPLERGLLLFSAHRSARSNTLR